ncbi:hypothetical protein DPMN_070210 [Dreissena polymorpha]|uniref:Uncharacterized protein n=1 Tax=Dreissena polymorpha TaxID=45954 RepID=A0A9D4BVH2_DREPO|nr:hypothetical protein DPMN_070210 [Dreissena polymorpha]
MKKRRIQNPKPDRSGLGITMIAHSTVSLQGGCDKLGNKACQAINMATKGPIINPLNVGALLTCGKIHELTHELKHYRLDII